MWLFSNLGADPAAPIQSDTAHFTQDKRMDLEQCTECPKKFESALERQTIKAHEGGTALVPELILSDVLPWSGSIPFYLLGKCAIREADK